MQRILPNKSQALGFLAALIFLNVVGALSGYAFSIVVARLNRTA